MNKELTDIWSALLTAHKVNSPVAEQCYSAICESYTGPKRHYHNLGHLQHMFTQALALQEEIENWSAFAFAIFYHDTVYDVKRKDNEAKSAKMAEHHMQEMGIDQEIISITHQHILATFSHEARTHADTPLLLDIDLSILGAERELYAEYASNIRKEYSFYPDFLFKKGRRGVLNRFLDKEEIYTTSHFAGIEEQAREKLRWELTIR